MQTNCIAKNYISNLKKIKNNFTKYMFMKYMVFCPCMQEHELQIMINIIISKNVINKIIKESNIYVQL
jgi:hypothetical protein